MNTLVCGSRFETQYYFVRKKLDELKDSISCVIHGGSDGVDKAAGSWAKLNGIPEIIVPAQWNFYEISAGPIRNGWMLRFVKVERIIAFPGGKGTENMIKQGLAANIPIMRIIDEQ